MNPNSKMIVKRNQSLHPVQPVPGLNWMRPSKFNSIMNIENDFKKLCYCQFIFYLCTSYKTMAGSSSYRFGVLARIVRHMRSRHQEGDDHPLSLDDILDETNQLDVGNKVKQVGLL